MTIRSSLCFLIVLIESDWNLKHAVMLTTIIANVSINRIRLEFKVYRDFFGLIMENVLIESDWNLKLLS